MMVTFWNNLLDPIGREQELGWSAVARMLREPAVFRGDKEHPGWSPATFRDQRRAKDGVRRVFAVCLDYDGGETIEAAVGRWGAFAGVIQTTRKHTAEAPRFRVVLPLARSVSSFEFAALWSRVNAHAGGKLDPAPKDGSRFWFMPGTLEGGTFETRLLSGFDLDPDEWLARPDPEARKAAARIDNSDLDRSDQRIKRALAYVSRMDGAVDGSHGHKATWAVACVLVKGFSLSQRDALGILANDYNPRCQPPWPAKDLEHKIRQAAKADLPDGYLLGDEAPRRSTGASMRDVDIPPEPIEGESHTETPAGGGDFEEEPMREPGDDTEAIELEKANPPPPTAMERFGVVTLRSMYRAVIDDLGSGKNAAGFKCGIVEIDEALGGFRLGNVTLMAAGTSFGKSSFGLLVTRQNLTEEARPLIISVEDKLLLYSRRLAASECSVNALQLRDREVRGEPLARLVKRANEVPDLPVFIDAVGKTVEWVAEAIRTCAKELGTRLVICDYVQRFRAAKNISDRRNQVTYVAETLSDAIKMSDCAGILLSQLKRTDGKEPTMDDVKESGDLENMAEHVIIGWRNVIKGRFGEDANVERKANIPKNKDGPIETNWIPLSFNETTASFRTTEEARFAQRDSRGMGQWDNVADNAREA